MDFGKFRLGGELSDIEVVVDETQLQLHRFPLYTRSDYFLKEFAKLGSQKTITLNKFPGGAQTFTIIADYCYNILVNITVENVISLRCGAKYLEMYGSGNLYEKTGLVIEGIVGNGRRGKEIGKLIQLITSIPAFLEDETTEHTLEHCVTALAYHWGKCQYGMTAVDEMRQPQVLVKFFSMPFDFFIRLLQMLKEKSRNTEPIDVLVSEYIVHVLDGEVEGDKKADSDADEEVCSLTNGDQQNGVEHAPHSEEKERTFSDASLKIVQTLLNDIQPNLSKNTASKWLKPLLEAYSQVEGSDDVLGSIAASMANQMDEDSMERMSERTLISFAERVDSASLSERSKSLIADQLVTRVNQGQLTTKGFMAIVRKLALNQSSNQDNLLHIISTLNAKDEGFTEEDLNECMSMVDVKKCTVAGLRRVQLSGGIPPVMVAKACLDLCEHLQEMNEISSKIIQEQEKEISGLSLKSYGLLKVDTSPTRTQKVRASSHSNLYTSPVRAESVRGGSPTASSVRGTDGLWSDSKIHSNGSHVQDTKMAELLRKQRQNKLWK